jgi:DNA-binding LytR/AlgR family response regulator
MLLNCIIIDDDETCQKIAWELIQKMDFLNLLHTFSSPIEALNSISTNGDPIDILFVDIEMPGMNGLEFIQSLPYGIPGIIITTSHKEFAIDAFENHVLDYLVKPLTYERFSKAVLKAKEIINKQPLNNEDVLFIKNESERIKIKGNDILYLKANGDHVTIYTTSKTHIIYSTLQAMEKKLFSSFYARIHRSFIARIDKIDFFDDLAVIIKDTTLPIGSKYKDSLINKIKII